MSPFAGSAMYTVSDGTDTRIELAGAGAPGVCPWAPASFSTVHAGSSSARASAATSVYLARDIENGPFARVYPRRSAEAAIVVPTPAGPPAFHPGYTPVSARVS